MGSLRVLLFLTTLATRALAHGFINKPAMRGGTKPSSINAFCPHCLGSTNLPMPICGNDAFFSYSDGPLTTLRAGEKFEVGITITAHHRGHFLLRLCDQQLGPGMSKDPDACLNEHVLHRVRPEEMHADCKIDDPRGDCQPIDERNPGYWYLPPPGWEDRELQVAGADWQDSMADRNEQKETVVHPSLAQNATPQNTRRPGSALIEVGSGATASASYKFHYRLPSALTCEKCTLQWAWKSANSCSPHQDAYNCYFQYMESLGWHVSSWCSGACTYSGTCPSQQGRPIPCGEEFANCADVKIEAGDVDPTPAPTDGGATPEPGTPEPGTPEPGTPEPETPEPETPEPETPGPEPEHAKELVAFVENWKPCPTISKIQGYSKVIVSFAVSYTWSPQKNICSPTCQISPPAICANSAQPGLVQSWQAAGTKVLISFGGAGMGGSWAGDVNDCWETCFDRVDSVVDQLTNIINGQQFDGIDIDYEYFHTPKSTAFLRGLTLGLRASLGAVKIISHAPMDGDVARGRPYYELLKEVATNVDYVLPQYYNGPHRPAQSLEGPLQHMGDLINDVFAGDQTKVLFGFCISDCSGTGSNVDSGTAVSIISRLKVAYPNFGGVFLWAASNDVGWSRAVADALGDTSSGTTLPPATTSSSTVVTTSIPSTTSQATTTTYTTTSTSQAPTTSTTQRPTTSTTQTLTTSAPSAGKCVRDTDCSRNAWCEAPGFEEWCEVHSATCPSPYCMRATSTGSTTTPQTAQQCVRDANCARNPWCTAPGYEAWCAAHNETCPAPYCMRPSLSMLETGMMRSHSVGAVSSVRKRGASGCAVSYPQHHPAASGASAEAARR